jgi:DNA-directed RNA polymerase specialized sigma24 family protein
MAEYEVRALRLACTIVGDRASADEVVADAFLKAYRHIGRFEAGRPFGPWFLKIVSHEAFGMARMARMARRAERAPGGRRARSGRAGGDERGAPAGDRRRPRATPQRAGRGHSPLSVRHEECAVAETLGWPLGTVKTWLHRARARLRDRLGGDLRMTEGHAR